MTDTRSDGQVSGSAAEIYDAFFVPALFGEWAPRVADALAPDVDARTLDVACGTGVLARELAARASQGKTVGVDRNPGMLAVARSRAPEIDWREASAEALPLPDADVDAVGCQFGLMFFDDRAAAIREMDRVLRPGGRLALAVWANLDATPGYAAMVGLLDRLFGKAIADELRAPFCLGDVEALRRLLARSGLSDANIATTVGMARFPSLDDWLKTDVKAWTLADRIDDDQFARLRQEASTELQRFVGADGRVTFDSPAHVVTITA